MDSRLTKTLLKITQDRQRTNILKGYEQKALAYLVQRIPSWVSSDALTIIGLLGSVIVGASFMLAAYADKYFLLMGVLGFFINWLGDSLDGRLAYYRNKPRKWYGFSLDYCTDWISNVFIGVGYIVYVSNHWELWGFVFVILYGWSMMIALLRYKITNVYTIDSGVLGPTEVRIIISFILALEVVVQGSIVYSTVTACAILFLFNVADFIKLLKTADRKDKEEQTQKTTDLPPCLSN
ncbi:MAG: CDP-alcohol phosphatidyltransferase [Prevotellaceae bacterium]|jgi:phosphatidylglycerophosphate synthase|nr:CDP-alcohol phosphatidyltransferase [Prevotellaceae bacterium]